MLAHRYFKLDVALVAIIGLVLIASWMVFATRLPAISPASEVTFQIADRSYDPVEDARANVTFNTTGSVAAALDQHERGTAALSNPAGLGPTVQSMSGGGSIPAALDQHERHANNGK